MHPILINIHAFSFLGMHIGPIRIHTYGVMVALGFLFGFWYMLKVAEKMKIKRDDMLDYFILLIVSGIVGARINYVMIYWKYYSQNPWKILALNEGGLVFYGGFLLGFIATIIFLKIKKIPFFDLMDLTAPAVALGHAFGRIGCFFNGCCYGMACHSSICLPIPALGDNIPRLPTQLFESAFNFILFFFLAKWQFKVKKKGLIFSSYLILYPIFRFINEIIRGDLRERGGYYLWHLTFSQLVSIGVCAVGIFFFVYSWKKAIPKEY
jgi:phosphatidylglycerol:prolipoprotein diacylglycerol transferase